MSDEELRPDWIYEVANGDTTLGFAEWCRHRAEATKSDVPMEVDFAARYWAGDWTEGDIGRRRGAWVCGEDDDPIFVWKGDDGPFLVLSFGPDGIVTRLAELDADGERIIMTTHDRETGEDFTFLMELDDDGVIIELGMADRRWPEEPPERELPGEEP